MPAKQSGSMLQKAIYEELIAKIPVDAVQTKTFGAKSDGYNIGYLIERLNKVLIPRGWYWRAEILPIQDESENVKTYIINKAGGGQGESQKPKITLSVHIKVSIYSELNEVVWSHESFGGCQMINNSLGDTLKGAQTDAMKKAFSYLGLGNEAFKGRIDDQLRQFYYRREYIIQAIGDFIKEKYKKNPNEELALRYISSVVQKDYQEIDDILAEDWEIVLRSLGIEDAKDEKPAEEVPKTVPSKKTEKKKVDEPEVGDGED